MSTPSLRLRIREATRPLHDKLDSHPSSARLLSPEVTKADYISFLVMNYGFLVPIERELVAFESLQEVHAFAPRSSALIADLKALGMADDAIATIPTLPEFEPITSLGEAMGVAYVVEGSAMGGLVIAKHLSRYLALTPECGLSFLLPHEPKQIVREFTAFATRLDSFASCACDERDAIEGARRTFAAVRNWMDRASESAE